MRKYEKSKINELTKEMARLIELKKDLKAIYNEAERELEEIKNRIAKFDNSTSSEVIKKAKEEEERSEIVIKYFNDKIKEIDEEFQEVSNLIKLKDK